MGKISSRIYAREALTRAYSTSKIDQWLLRASYASQILLLALGVFGYFYTVLPLYEKALLDEDIAQKTLNLREKERQVQELTVQIAGKTRDLEAKDQLLRETESKVRNALRAQLVAEHVVKEAKQAQDLAIRSANAAQAAQQTAEEKASAALQAANIAEQRAAKAQRAQTDADRRFEYARLEAEATYMTLRSQVVRAVAGQIELCHVDSVVRAVNLNRRPRNEGIANLIPQVLDKNALTTCIDRHLKEEAKTLSPLRTADRANYVSVSRRLVVELQPELLRLLEDEREKIRTLAISSGENVSGPSTASSPIKTDIFSVFDSGLLNGYLSILTKLRTRLVDEVLSSS